MTKRQKYMEQKMTEFKREIENSKTIAGNFHMPLGN